jgi:hypothetical protein
MSMLFSKIKIFFYILFVSDILLGTALAHIFNIVIGFTVAFILLFINIIVYAIMLRAEKIVQKTKIKNRNEQK